MFKILQFWDFFKFWVSKFLDFPMAIIYTYKRDRIALSPGLSDAKYVVHMKHIKIGELDVIVYISIK